MPFFADFAKGLKRIQSVFSYEERAPREGMRKRIDYTGWWIRVSCVWVGGGGGGGGLGVEGSYNGPTLSHLVYIFIFICFFLRVAFQYLK